MQFRQFSQVGRLQRVMIFLLLTFLAVCGEKEKCWVVGFREQQPSGMLEKQQHRAGSRKKLTDVYFSGKREVPNASDPLHNR
ncbi:hypothetical protein L6164_015483 [Bauhinia variegata]|uniref:Uncharacterized protein n=1 Tax=Bauhinia variegata TaxID=167791 RepID=A0ACB9NPF3_BAUVA|nr:hypothetical protein L6164_015483 [Bauhinia variegata]